jgi:threonine dehydrogenase-like Zn-dependent dehydrogenase
MLAHDTQLVTVPDDLSDEAAVLVEPTACALHAARRVVAHDGGATEVAVIGAGAIGLLTIAALHHLDPSRFILAAAKHPQQRELATALGASRVVEPNELDRAVRGHTASMRYGDQLAGGIGAVADCVGSADSLAQALRVVAPGGSVHVVGMPGITTLDLTPLWHRETSLHGCYAYDRADFDDAMELVRDLDLGRLVSATYPLARYEDAIAHAAEAGRRGAVKIAFDLRNERERREL